MKKLLILVLFALNAHCMTNDTSSKFNFAALPLDMQKLIMDDVLNNTQVTPQKLYNNLLNIKATSSSFKNLVERLKHEIKSGKKIKIANLKYLLSQALIYAVNGESLEIAELLLVLGANPKVWDPKIKRPIIESAKTSEIKQLLLNYGALENVPYNWQDDKIINAAFAGEVKDVKELIDAGADVSAKNLYMGRSALMIAATRMKLEIIRELINAGADVNGKDMNNYTALILATIHENLEIVTKLIKSGASVNAKEHCHYTALHYAAAKGNLKIVEELINGGSDVNLKIKNELTALDIAQKHRNKKIVNFLEQLNK